MKTTIDDYSAHLLKKIVRCSSSDEVRFCIDSAINGMKAGGVDPAFIGTFTNRMIFLLNECNPLFKTASEWNNIKIARSQFNRLRKGRMIDQTR